ncbi:MAG: peptidoglycan-binding protein [Nitrosospira sp.]|nr:peptidoglycan-binding protein [Nitrosospira sp.]
MAVITQTIQPGEQRNEVTEMQKALMSLGATVAPSELFTATAAGTYGPTTQAAVTALLQRFGLRPPPPPIFNTRAGRLLNIAVGAEVGNSAALKQAVRESFAVIQTAPVADATELAWLAQYAVIAQDFTTARQIAAQIPDEPVIKEKVGPIVNLTTLQPATPELVNPENYYTVVYDYVSRSEVQALLKETG